MLLSRIFHWKAHTQIERKRLQLNRLAINSKSEHFANSSAVALVPVSSSFCIDFFKSVPQRRAWRCQVSIKFGDIQDDQQHATVKSQRVTTVVAWTVALYRSSNPKKLVNQRSRLLVSCRTAVIQQKERVAQRCRQTQYPSRHSYALFDEREEVLCYCFILAAVNRPSSTLLWKLKTESTSGCRWEDDHDRVDEVHCGFSWMQTYFPQSALVGRRRSKRDKVVSREDVKCKRYGDSTRGVYEQVEPTVNAWWRKTLRIAPTFALLLAGTALMLAHHFFFAFLDSKIIDPGASDLPPILRDQTTPHIIGTLIAHGACAVLSMVIGSIFAQLFWEKVRTRRYSIQQIDALVQSGRSSLHLSMFRTMTATPLLFCVSLIAASMSLIVVLSRGALTVTSALQLSRMCLVPTAPNLVEVRMDPDTLLSRNWDNVCKKVLGAGTYMPPFRTETCAEGAATCSYNISFTGPAFKCFDISNQTDFVSTLNTSLVDINNGTRSRQSGLIWSGSWKNSSILVSTWDMVNNVMQANNCTVYLAAYKVGLALDEDFVKVQVLNIAMESIANTGGPEGDKLDTAMSAYIGAAMNALETTINVGANGDVEVIETYKGIESSNGMLPNSGIFVTTPSGNHTWTDNMTNVLTAYMQNISISLLSGNLYNNGTAGDEVPLDLPYINSTCISTWDGYHYSPFRLLSVYGVALISTLLIAIPGILLILRNGVEEKFVLSHIVLASSNLNAQFLDVPKTTVRNPEAELPGHVKSIQCSSALDQESRYRNLPSLLAKPLSIFSTTWTCFQGELQTRRIQMLVLVLSGVFCAVMQHLYYSFLDGKPPTSWITNQSVVSDTGIIIAYAGQTCFATAIIVSSSQRFWRIMRKRGHTVSQIDALMRVQHNPFSSSLLHCTHSSWSLVMSAFIVVLTPFISTITPNSIKISFNQLQSNECVVKNPRNLTSLETLNVSDYSVPQNAVYLSGSYLPPENLCSADFGFRCSYRVDFIGPGFSCSNITISSNLASFKFADYSRAWISSLAGDSANRTMRLSIQTWNAEGSLYRALDCAGVTRSYSLLITHNVSSKIEVVGSNVLSPVLVDPGVNLSMFEFAPAGDTHGINSYVTFMQQYLLYTMGILEGEIFISNGTGDDLSSYSEEPFSSLFSSPGIFFSTDAYWNIVFDTNMIEDLELFAQNATLSLLSGKIFALDSPDGPDLLEDFRTNCTYSVTSYDYSPSRLFTTYGVAIFLTLLCTAGGLHAVKCNGVDESMNFARFLRAVSNERMLNVREMIEMETMVKADNDPEGGFAPVLESDI
ncbi:hypothetical protein SCHPADRAFT_971531 [Schizopora paradoxa]|uniref:Uncharacterized protein n=1 Tax=Schizopora paradoxa TaxID=27342 RepID=A0A0H2RM12_9AGAM|nr:hypothetical protein SCHPADRAFT_971531 [Schizopora paradoxa]